jgi:uncharacterized protein with GYD domain
VHTAARLAGFVLAHAAWSISDLETATDSFHSVPLIARCPLLTGEESMPMYLTRFSYTPETWARLIKHPEDRRAAAAKYIESVGGKLHGFWYAFGEHDGYNLWEAPDNVSMAATALAIGAGGSIRSIQTTVLMTVDETIAALGKASSIAYRQPGT